MLSSCKSIATILIVSIVCAMTSNVFAQDEDPPFIPDPLDLSLFTPDDWLRGLDHFDRIEIRLGPAGDKQVIILDVLELEGDEKIDIERPLLIGPGLPDGLSDQEIPFFPIVALLPAVEIGEALKVARRNIVSVMHWEDLLLAQGDKYLDMAQRDGERSQELLNIAFDFYHRVATERPFWPNLARKKQDYLFQESRIRMAMNDNFRALHILRQLRKLNPDYPRAKEELGRVIGNILTRLYDDQRDFVQSRHYLHLLEEDYPDHPVFMSWRNKIMGESQGLATSAKRHEQNSNLRQASLDIHQAVDIWPALPGIKNDFDRICSQYSLMKVGVRELPRRFAPWTPAGSGDSRVATLLYAPLMEVSGVGENTKFSSDLMVDGQPELKELNRRVVIRVKQGLTWSDKKPITSTDIARALTARTDNPAQAHYDAALSGVLKSYILPDPAAVLEVDLRRTQLRPETNFMFNLARTGNHLRGLPVSSGPYKVHSHQIGVEARIQASDYYFGGKPKVSEIIEQPFSDAKVATNALLAADIDMLEHVHPRQLSRFEPRDDIHVVKGRIPALHVINFDFRRYEFHNRTLRQAIAYAIDRKTILESGILSAPSTPENEIAEGPFPKGSYAYDKDIEPIEYDPQMALALANAAKKQLGARSLRFTLQYPDFQEVEEGCQFIKTYLSQNLGIEIDLRPRPYQELEEDIARGQRFDLVYRIHFVRDPVLDAARVMCLGQPITPDGQTLPNCATGWLRQDLQQLELATNWEVARKKLKQIQGWVARDIAIIPLWQLTEYSAFHERVHGPKDNSLDFYQDIESWSIDPWYRTDKFSK